MLTGIIAVLLAILSFGVNPFIIYKIIDGNSKSDVLKAYKYATIVFVVNFIIAGVLWLLGF